MKKMPSSHTAMRSRSSLGVAPLALVFLLASGPRASAQTQGGQLTQVVCDGTACGGSGGAINRPYCYRVKPNGHSVTFLEVGVEDGDSTHYANVSVPTSWTMTVVQTTRAHGTAPTQHGGSSGSAGTCPYVLRFAGPGKTANFEVGYAYTRTASGYHDAHWKTSGGYQALFGAAVGTNNGPVHSPISLNVLLIVLDDVGSDQMGLFDSQLPADQHEHARTPRLDALANDGIHFHNFFVNPVCSTTRACLQTGRYAFRHGIGNVSSVSLPDTEVTLAELLKRGISFGQPYACGAFGKWHLTPILDPDQDDYSTYNVALMSHAVRNGYDRFYGSVVNNGNHFDFRRVTHDTGLAPLIGTVTTRWDADLVREDAVDWIRSTGAPFFAYVAFNPPHYGLTVPPYATAGAGPRQMVSSTTQDELAAIGLFAGAGAGPQDVPGWRAKWRLVYRSMLEAVDSEIGFLIDDLGTRMQNTMVIVVCDNGTEGELIELPHDSGQGKDHVFALGVRVPMIVKGPLVRDGVPPNGWRCDRLVGAVDLWRTIAEITGASETQALGYFGVAPTLDSMSFLPLIQDPNGAGSRALAFSQVFGPDGLPIDCLTRNDRSLFDGQYQYILMRMQGCGGGGGTAAAERFYDFTSDPFEDTNLLDMNGDLITFSQPAQNALNALRNLMSTSDYGGP